MLFNVSGLMLEGIGATRAHKVDGHLQTQGRPSERLTGDVKLMRTPAGVLVQAHFDLIDSESCSRCLEPLEETLAIEVEEEFRAMVDPNTGQAIPPEAHPDPSNPDLFTIDERHDLDLTEAVRQYREAAGDMQPLCRPDCRGLCPRCGSNLNSGDCSCESGSIDSRWATLGALQGASLEEKE